MDSLLGSLSELQGRTDDDIADRLSSRYSVAILVTCALIVGMNGYVRDPITCWAPVHFTDSHTRYTNNYCWVRNTYYLPWSDEIPREDEPHQTILYYQWVPIILLAQAFFFYLPSIVWHALNQRSGVDADSIMDTAHRLTGAQEDDPAGDHILLLIGNQFHRLLDKPVVDITAYSRLRQRWQRIADRYTKPGQKVSNYLVILFLVSKLCYIANAFGQLFVLNRILSTRYNLYGFEIMKYLVSDHDWTEARTVPFPRVTLCDFRIRRLGNIHRYTVQCVLPINLYIEKIYMFLWFWLVFVVAASLLSFVTWLLRALYRSDRLKFVRNHLRERLQDPPTREEGEAVDLFLDDYLRQDGAFLMRLIAHNTCNATTTEVMCKLWDRWRDSQEAMHASAPPQDEGIELQPMMSSKFA